MSKGARIYVIDSKADKKIIFAYCETQEEATKQGEIIQDFSTKQFLENEQAIKIYFANMQKVLRGQES